MEDWHDAYFNSDTYKREKKNEFWGKKEDDRKRMPIYKQIARDALMSWNGLSEEEATKKVQESSNKELEAQVHAEGSIDYALKGLHKYSELHYGERYGLADWLLNDFKEVIMTGDCDKTRYTMTFDDYTVLFWNIIGRGRDGFDVNDMILTALTSIHDGWVQDNQEKFMARDKKYQHMPIELIGWKEAKSDLLFLKPILSEMEVEYDEKKLEEYYNQRVQAFLEEKGITNVSELTEQISRGAEFYPALEGQDDIVQALQDTEFVEQHVVSGIREKGIGKNEQFAQKLFSERTIEGADELEALRTQKKDLVEQERTISEAEKLIEAKENQGQSLDE